MADIKLFYTKDCVALAKEMRKALTNAYHYIVHLQDLEGAVPVSDDTESFLTGVLLVSLNSYIFMKTKPHISRVNILKTIFPDRSTGSLVFIDITENEFTAADIDKACVRYDTLWKCHDSEHLIEATDIIRICHNINLKNTIYQSLPPPVPVCRAYPDTIFSLNQEVVVISNEAHTENLCVEIDDSRLNTEVKRPNPFTFIFLFNRIDSYGCKSLTLVKEVTNEHVARCSIEVIPSSEAVGRTIQSSSSTDNVLNHRSRNTAGLDDENITPRKSANPCVKSNVQSCDINRNPERFGRNDAITGEYATEAAAQGSSHTVGYGADRSSLGNLLPWYCNISSCSSYQSGDRELVDKKITQEFAWSGSSHDYDHHDTSTVFTNLPSPYYKLPTWLHFAARYGMKNLATGILSSPIANDALFIKNVDGDLPDVLAQKHGHAELAEYLRNLLDLSDMIDSIYANVPETPAPPVCDGTIKRDYVNRRADEHHTESADSGLAMNGENRFGDVSSISSNRTEAESLDESDDDNDNYYFDMNQVQKSLSGMLCPSVSDEAEFRSTRVSQESRSSADSGCRVSDPRVSSSSSRRSNKSKEDEPKNGQHKEKARTKHISRSQSESDAVRQGHTQTFPPIPHCQASDYVNCSISESEDIKARSRPPLPLPKPAKRTDEGKRSISESEVIQARSYRPIPPPQPVKDTDQGAAASSTRDDGEQQLLFICCAARDGIITADEAECMLATWKEQFSNCKTFEQKNEAVKSMRDSIISWDSSTSRGEQQKPRKNSLRPDTFLGKLLGRGKSKDTSRKTGSSKMTKRRGSADD